VRGWTGVGVFEEGFVKPGRSIFNVKGLLAVGIVLGDDFVEDPAE
jgi:hypothetical protein